MSVISSFPCLQHLSLVVSMARKGIVVAERSPYLLPGLSQTARSSLHTSHSHKLAHCLNLSTLIRSALAMDIQVILNPGAAGSPLKYQHETLSRRGTPLQKQSSRRSVRSSSPRLSYRTKSKPTAEPHDVAPSSPAPIAKRSSSLRESDLSAATRFEQLSTRKRPSSVLAMLSATTTKRARRDSSSHSHSSSNATATSCQTTASMLLSRARQHVARERETVPLGQRTLSIMDVVMDLKGPTVADNDEFLQAIIDSARRTRCRWNYRFLTQQDVDSYWQDQAAICSSGEPASAVLSHFPVSSERLTATWGD
ncbi:unnamed protein product [Mycena citricolor]|uniref:Uncharacterized protein n=1 Tax=Mycena citricolor TaxID=2018698 RepID=A0AAD2HI21_9AGAR|nr:unnamed protein product [Mycena citricolor]